MPCSPAVMRMNVNPRLVQMLVAATEQPKNRLCRACFDGEYPIELPEGNLLGKHLLEGLGKRLGHEEAGLEPAQTTSPHRGES